MESYLLQILLTFLAANKLEEVLNNPDYYIWEYGTIDYEQFIGSLLIRVAILPESDSIRYMYSLLTEESSNELCYLVTFVGDGSTVESILPNSSYNESILFEEVHF